MNNSLSTQFLLFKKRRTKLLENVRKHHASFHKGVIIICGSFEDERYGFRQNSSFYYLTGITEPAAVLCIYLDGREVLYLPNFGNEREKWVVVDLNEKSNPADFCLTEIKHLNAPAKGYSFTPFFKKEHYNYFLYDLEKFVDDQTAVFTILDGFERAKLFDDWQVCLPKLGLVKKDIMSFLHEQRRIKDEHELEFLRIAINLTVEAQHKAAQFIKPGMLEYQVQAAIEYVFTYGGATRPSFPTIVATGKNTTVLHYVDRNKTIKDGDLVVVDIGAEYGYYAADLTRTYPANGKFTKRQQEIYETVLAAQEYIASIAKPGMFLRNPQQKEKSLHYCTVKFFEERGLAQYFPHSLGHYLGLDVHDVGDYAIPLQSGDVFTIEPGLYIPAESLGVRIEDDYLITAHGVECLSKALPKKPHEIELMLQ